MVKITKLEIENVKRVKAISLEPTPNGLTVIGGRNGQGKTSILDSIAWTLGGNRYKPSNPKREGSFAPPYVRIELSNGLIAERKGANSDLKVTDPSGRKAGQQLLNEFVETFALDIPKFMAASDKDKADTLLKIIGLKDEVSRLERAEADAYNQRHTIGQIADRKRKFAEEQPYYPEAPNELISASELIRRQQDILATNGENQKKRQKAEMLKALVDRLELDLEELNARYEQAKKDLLIAQKSASELQDQSTAELERSISEIDEINAKIRANLDKSKAEEDAAYYGRQYSTLTAEIERLRLERQNLLSNAQLPLPELYVVDGALTYRGLRWDCLSGSDQLKVATAIVRKINPNCGFVLLDKLEQMDPQTMAEFGKWLESEGLQAIATRVSSGAECSIIISDGYVLEGQPSQKKQWKVGEF